MILWKLQSFHIIWYDFINPINHSDKVLMNINFNNKINQLWIKMKTINTNFNTHSPATIRFAGKK